MTSPCKPGAWGSAARCLTHEGLPLVGGVCVEGRYASGDVPLTLRCLASTGQWWALNKRESGWSSFGFPFEHLGDALDHFNVRLIGFGVDAHGLYLVAVSS